MAVSAMTPKLLDRISNNEYQEKDKWKIDDIALGPANELLISGHNLEIPKTFVSVHKEDSGKYGNRPEYNRNFRQTQPGEQLALFLEGSSIIGLKVESALQLVTVKDMGVFKTLKWKRSPTCICFYRGKLYAASSSSTIVNVCNLDSEEKSDIFLSDMKSDYVLEIVVVMEKIYVCTKDAGRALVFSMTGSKKMEFKNALQPDAMAKSICIHERTELVFVSWNNFQIQLYSQKTSRCLRAFDMTEELHKIRVTTENILATLSASNCTVTVYDVGEIIKFGEFEKTILSSVKKKHRKKLISHDKKNFECHPANSETHTTTSSPWNSASKQSKTEKLRDSTELFIKQQEETENLRRKYDRDTKKLNEKIQKLEGMKTELESQQKTLKDNLDEEKRKLIERIKELESTRTELESQQKTLNDNLDEEKRKLNEKTKELESTRTELESQQKKLKDDLDEEKRKVSRNERSRVQLNEKIQKLEGMKTELESQQKTLKDNLDEEKGRLIERIKELESTRTEHETQQKKLKDDLDEEKRKVSREERLRVQLNEKIQELECMKTELESQQNTLKDHLDREQEKVLREQNLRIKGQIELETMKRDRLGIFGSKKRRNDNDQTKQRLYQTEEEMDILRREKKQLEKEKDTLIRQKQQMKNENEEEKNKGEINKHVCTKLVAEMDTLKQQNDELKKCMKEQNKRLEGNESRTPVKRRPFTEDELKIQVKEEERWSEMFSAGHEQNKTQSLFVSHLMTIFESQEDDKMKLRQEQMQAVVNSMEGKIKRFEEGISKSKAALNELEKSTVDLEADKKQLTLQLSNCPDETLLQNGQESVLLKVKSFVDEFEEEIMKREEQNKEMAATLSEKMASFKDLEIAKSKLSEEYERLSKEKMASLKDLEISKSKLSEEYERLSKEVTLARFLSDTSKFDASQRNDSNPYWFDDTDPAVSESMDSGIGTSNLETDDCFSGSFLGNFDQICQELKVAVTVSSKGTQMLIPDTGVELYVPGGSLLNRQLIEIRIIDFDNDFFDAVFSSDRNSSVAVQLLPYQATLRWPARLRLPHCLRLKANFQELKSNVKIYRSEHAPGQDVQWEHDPELKYELKEDCCIIFVKKFCSLRYDVIEEAIDATKVTVFTGGKQHGTSMELAVGYHLDLPGRREMLLTMNNDMKIFKAKPFEFVKESTDTLQAHLTTAVSRTQNDEKTTTEVDGKLSVFEAAAKIAELPLDRPKPLHLSDASNVEGNQHISTAMLKVSETVSNKGTTMRILDTGIELDIPPNAFQGYRYIEMSVVHFGTLDEPISTFSSNSSVIVELLPNRATLKTPVRLSLPHCLKLKEGYSKDTVKVYLSHHEKDQKPFWEELPDAKYALKADHCIIYLTSFCWVKYEIDNKIVVAKRIKVYTATRGMEQNDQIAEVEVGYFIDMPGRAENLRENVDLKISQCKPLLFFKEGNLPLQIFLIKVLPMFWKYSTPDRNPKVIPYKIIADSLDKSLPFVFEKQDANEQKPFAMFRVSQGNEEVEINIRL